MTDSVHFTGRPHFGHVCHAWKSSKALKPKEKRSPTCSYGVSSGYSVDAVEKMRHIGADETDRQPCGRLSAN